MRERSILCSSVMIEYERCLKDIFVPYVCVCRISFYVSKYMSTIKRLVSEKFGYEISSPVGVFVTFWFAFVYKICIPISVLKEFWYEL